jgi:hypothetical protein
MTRLPQTTGVCAVVAAAFAIVAAPARATWEPSAVCDPTPNSFVIFSNFEFAQTFEAKSSGKLLKVFLKGISRQPGGSGADINVSLYEANETGAPEEPVLASTKITGASVTADAFAHDYTAEFERATAAYLNAGTTYGIGLKSSETKQDAWNTNESNPCPDGETFIRLASFEPAFSPNLDAGIKAYQAPPNDEFAHRFAVSGQEVTVEGSTAGASREPEEPDHYTQPLPDNGWEGDHSVWYSWTAPNSGPTTMNTCTGEIDSILAVYTGSALGELTRVTDNNNDPACAGADEYGSKVSFEAVGGTTYDIAVGDAGGAREGGFLLKIVGAPDTTPPETQIDSGPSATTTDHSPSFAFSSEPGATFECRIDAAPFAACASPKAYGSLPDGAHTFAVRAIDQAMNVDPTPASRSFTEITPPKSSSGGQGGNQAGNGQILPDTKIGKARISQAKSKATFKFTSDQPGSTFLCKLDGMPFRACRSPKTYRHLRPGRHRFQVEAVSSGGTDSSPASRPFRIKP